MRGGVLSVLTGCGFSVTAEPGYDASVDAPPDAPDAASTTWTLDGTSGIAVPRSTQEWTDLFAAHSVSAQPPSHVWLMQDTAGNLQDTIGTVPLLPINTPTYGHNVTGWERRAVGTAVTSSVQGFYSSQLGNLNGTSNLMLVYVAVAVNPPSERVLFALGRNLDYRYVAVTADGRYCARGNGVTPARGSTDMGTQVHPVLLKIDATHQQLVVYSDAEKISAAWTPTAGLGNNLVVGSGGYGSANARYLYAALWSGAAAELDDATIRNLLSSLGWDAVGF